MIRTAFLFTLSLLTCSPVWAQDARFQATVQGSGSEGFYKIPLSPQARQCLNPGLSNLRIYDPAGKEVPYLVFSEPMLKSGSSFVEYKIASQKHYQNHSEIVVENPGKDLISNIAFNITNSDAHKYCAVEGSNDQQQWYSVSAQQELSLAYNNQYANSCKVVYFPAVDYKYIKLLIEDWQSQPLKINSTGFFKNSVVAGKLNVVPATMSIAQNTQRKTTTLHLDFGVRSQVSRIDFKVKSPRLFMRSARLYVPRQATVNRRTESYNDPVDELTLSSDGSLWFDLNNFCEKELYIEIQNNDNQPLEFDSVVCRQLASYLVCELKPGATYSLCCGNPSLPAPNYDLANFVSKIPQLLPETPAPVFMPVDNRKADVAAAPAKEKPFYEQKGFLWLCVALGCIVIFLFSRSLLKDMRAER